MPQVYILHFQVKGSFNSALLLNGKTDRFVHHWQGVNVCPSVKWSTLMD